MVNLSLVFKENQNLVEFSPIMKVSFQRTIGVLAYIVISSHFDDYPYEKQLSTSKP